MTYRKAYCEATKLVDKALELTDSWHSQFNGMQRKYQHQVTQHEASVRLLDSYMQCNARQGQDIIELESVAIALYDVLWHQVHSVENELEEKHAGVADLNAYKTIKALFEAEGDAE